MKNTKPKKGKLSAGPAGIEYHGIAGCSMDCQNAVVRLLQFGEPIAQARILTCENKHGLLLTNGDGDRIAIKNGFASGYGGTGPTCLSHTLQLLDTHGCQIDECEVDYEFLERLDQSALTMADVESIISSDPVLPTRWHDYILERHFDASQKGILWRDFHPTIPFALIDERIFDLALSFWNDPDDKLMKGYRRLEDAVRKRTGSNEHGQKLFSAAFLGEDPILGWEDIDKTEKIGRANLFTGTYMAYRNPRAHHELKRDSNDQLAEFLLLNHLFQLEKECTRPKIGGKK